MPTSVAPSQSLGPPRFSPAIQRDEGATLRSRASSAMAQPRIEQRDHEVHDEIKRDEEHGKGQDQTLNHCNITVHHAFNPPPAPPPPSPHPPTPPAPPHH